MAYARIHIPDPIEASYVSYLFPKNKDTGRCQVKCSQIVGRLLVALASPDQPKPREHAGAAILVELPKSFGLKEYGDTELYYSEDDEFRIREAVSAMFDLDFFRYYMKGMEYGYEKRETIEMFIISRGLLEDEPFERLHKRVYRRELRAMQARREQLLRKAKYFFDERNDLPPRK